MSFGIAGMGDTKKATIDELIGRADKALYQAKEQGGNRCIIADYTGCHKFSCPYAHNEA